MNSSLILSVVTFIYGLAGFLYIFAWIFKKPTAGRMATWVALVGLIGNTAGILMRWVESYRMGIGHAPFSNLFESLVFFAWTIALIYLVIERRANNRIIGVSESYTSESSRENGIKAVATHAPKARIV